MVALEFARPTVSNELFDEQEIRSRSCLEISVHTCIRNDYVGMAFRREHCKLIDKTVFVSFTDKPKPSMNFAVNSSINVCTYVKEKSNLFKCM